MNYRAFLQLALGRGCPRVNPVSAFLWKGQSRPSQSGMLIAATLFIIAVTFFGKAAVRTRSDLLIYVLLRWGIAEFFWVWMAADHLISTIKRLRENHVLDEWRLTALTPNDLIRGFIGPSVTFLLIALTAHSVVDLFVPYGITETFQSSPRLELSWWEDFVVWRGLLTVALWISCFATIAVASTWSCRVALESPLISIHGAWFNLLCRCLLLVGCLNFLSLVTGGLVVAIGILAARMALLPVDGRDVALLGTALVLGIALSGSVKIAIPGRREWSASLDRIEQYTSLQEESDSDSLES